MYVRDNTDVAFLFQCVDELVESGREGVDSFTEAVYRALDEYTAKRVTKYQLIPTIFSKWRKNI